MKEIVSSPGGEPELVFQTESPGLSNRLAIPEYVSLGKRHSAIARAAFAALKETPLDGEWCALDEDELYRLTCEQVIPTNTFPGALRGMLREIRGFYNAYLTEPPEELFALAGLNRYRLTKLQEELQLTDFELEEWGAVQKERSLPDITAESFDIAHRRLLQRVQDGLKSNEPPKTLVA